MNVKKVVAFVCGAIGWLWVAVWYLFVLVWPVGRWAIGLLVFFRFVAMFLLWSDPGSNPLLDFIAVFMFQIFLEYMARCYVPGKLRGRVKNAG